ncbi:MAG: glycosyltransferase family 52 protein, partial [Clostridiales Family XIII bacterium]|nr:glycosyltransferase family 52 protein [Clostridiales Family XIII bacterium]
MKSFVTQTYFHLMRAIAMGLALNEKPMLYIITDYMGVKEDMVERIRETGVFADVTPIDYQVFLAPFVAELRQTAGLSAKEIDGIGDSIFEKHLTPYFAGVFEHADKDDDVYIFNDLGWYYYYVERNFRTIIGVEDSYRGFDQYLKIATYQGNAERLFPFAGKYYPPHHFKSEKVAGIISSCPLPDIEPPYAGKITVSDYNEIAQRNAEKFKRSLLHIFDVEKLEIKPGGTLYLTQPLSRASYCTALDNYLINKKLIREELKTADHLYIKPHPADDFDYKYFESERVILLPQKMPSEILGFLGVRFAKSIAFDSRTVVHEDYIDAHVSLYNPKTKSRRVFEKFLANYVRGEKLTVDLYYKMPELSGENYMGFFSCPVKHPQIDFRLTALVPAGSEQSAREFLSAARFRDNKTHYVAEAIGKGVRRLRRMTARAARANLRIFRDSRLRIIAAEAEGSIAYLKNIIKHDDGRADYFMLIDRGNTGSEALRLFHSCVRKRMPFVFAFSSSYQDEGVRLPLQCEAAYGSVAGIVSHKMWQRKLLDECGAYAEVN